MNKKTCFVAIGFGPKIDYETGRLLDLDKTFEYLIKPVFEELDIECFRAKEIRHSGIIDVPMYEWLLKADIVVADISTLNPNALYELGVRHALRPFSTIVISEDKLRYPFDINHTLIQSYEHLGKDIGISEARRFTRELKKLVEEILSNKKKDSPVYTYLPKLKEPSLTEEQIEEIIKVSEDKAPFSELLEDAENAKNNNEFTIAAELYKVCLKFEPQNVFLRQRLALVTYKSQRPNPEKALRNAENILDELFPEETTDPETLGLSGAINKRLYELTNEETYLDKAMWFYERGFYIQRDYYNGINLAYLLTVKSLTVADRYEAISFYLQANRIRERIVEICRRFINQKEFKKRGDREWIYQSLAQAYLGLGQEEKINEIIPEIESLSKGQFDLDTFKEQNRKLISMMEDFVGKHNYPN
ncbi:MAG: DUF4071 domain-containing protein [Pyrinomonadaceae bacterium]|nr:DUF4071 domain-containing protein [Pyrinomonadaceae bacterium]